MSTMVSFLFSNKSSNGGISSSSSTTTITELPWYSKPSFNMTSAAILKNTAPPSLTPSLTPSSTPSEAPTKHPTMNPLLLLDDGTTFVAATEIITELPSATPSEAPTRYPTPSPTTFHPTSDHPTYIPTTLNPTPNPTTNPTQKIVPDIIPPFAMGPMVGHTTPNGATLWAYHETLSSVMELILYHNPSGRVVKRYAVRPTDRIYRAPLTGLSPSTTYPYEMRLHGRWVGSGSFTTAPPPPPPPVGTQQQQQQQQFIHRRRLADATPIPASCRVVANPAWMVIWWILLLVYMFLALSIVCDEFFVPALEVMSDEHHLNLSMDVAGATLMAAGGSAPELATNFVSTFQESELGIGTIVGSAVFNVLFVIAMCSLLAKTTLTLTWWPLFRDATYYAITLIVLALFLSVSGSGNIVVWESIVLLVLYLGYCTFMYFNQFLYKALTGKELEYPEEPPDSDDDDEEEKDKEDKKIKDKEDKEEGSMGDEISSEGLNNNKQEETATSATPAEAFVLPKQGSYSNRTIARSQSNHTNSRSQWQNTFRAGILKLLRDPDSWLDTAGVGIVAKMAGDVNQVFAEVDVNGDGSIDRHELELLFEKLECHLSPHELDEVFAQLDTDGDNQVSFKMCKMY
mmetsp:Transcript_24180/g.36775  ORF Transcript_24180/g.36775 Transcript_24180/m.36775 type:complete len:628 (+) Transcript_24180:528-2411(+)